MEFSVLNATHSRIQRQPSLLTYQVSAEKRERMNSHAHVFFYWRIRKKTKRKESESEYEKKLRIKRRQNEMRTTICARINKRVNYNIWNCKVNNCVVINFTRTKWFANCHWFANKLQWIRLWSNGKPSNQLKFNFFNFRFFFCQFKRKLKIYILLFSDEIEKNKFGNFIGLFDGRTSALDYELFKMVPMPTTKRILKRAQEKRVNIKSK